MRLAEVRKLCQRGLVQLAPSMTSMTLMCTDIDDVDVQRDVDDVDVQRRGPRSASERQADTVQPLLQREKAVLYEGP